MNTPPPPTDPLTVLKNDEASVLRQIAQLEGALLYIRQFRQVLETKETTESPAEGRDS